MKKAIALLLALCLCVGLCACGAESESSKSESPTMAEEHATEPIPQVLMLSEVKIQWLDTETYVVGENMQVNEYGLISQVEQTYDIIAFEYNDLHQVVKATITDKSDGTVGYEAFSYDGMAPVSSEKDLNDGFTYTNTKDISTTTDDAGHIVEITQQIVYKDPDDGSTKSETSKYEIEYDDAGRVAFLTYYSDGEIDHTSTFTYDENGNMLSYANKGEDGSVYLRVDFVYTMVDATDVTIPELDPFTVYQNWEYMIDHIL